MIRLSKYYEAVASKILSAVETNPNMSNQHEFNGVNGFRDIFGAQKKQLYGKFILLNDDPEETIIDYAYLTWYDAREKHPTRTEYRLYYSSNDVIANSSPGDLLIICKTSENDLTIIVAPGGSTSERQLRWLFSIDYLSHKFQIKEIRKVDTEISFNGKYILSLLGVDVIRETSFDLEEMVSRFKGGFPSTRIFSEYARSKVHHAAPVDYPDHTLIQWIETEEELFRLLEKHIVEKKLREGFENDVDEFISYSLSVQNRRKSRAGHAFENHLEAIFQINGIRYVRGSKTERNNKPDFLFPGIKAYSDLKFPPEYLTMLGVKTSAKDRWRQVLSEADRIPLKHLITLEPAISENQTKEIKEQQIQLVLPESIMSSYSVNQLSDIISLQDFIRIIRSKEEKRYA